MNVKNKPTSMVRKVNLYLTVVAAISAHAGIWHSAGLDWVEGVSVYFMYGLMIRSMDYIAGIGLTSGVYAARGFTSILLSLLVFYSATVIYRIDAALWPTVLIVAETLLWGLHALIKYSHVARFWRKRAE